MGQIFESVMLICFGFSWPMNVMKAYKARTAKGTSLAFIILIITGYIAGITAKFINHQLNYVLAVYFLNLVIVFLNVVVYIRNVALDKKREAEKAENNIVTVENEEEKTMEITYSQEENIDMPVATDFAETVAEKNQVVLVGGALDRRIPLASLAEEFDFNFKLYNRSKDDISLKSAEKYFNENIKEMQPEAVMLHIGENDKSMFQNNSSDFDKYYLSLINKIKSEGKKTRIALISVKNSENDKVIAEMNRHIKAIAESENCTFVNLDSVQLWNPEATKAAVDFAYTMGVRTRKPLMNVAEIIYSYAYKEMPVSPVNQTLVG
jgi:low affinity Fe/Cu permease